MLSAAEVAGFAVFGENVRVVRGERIYEPAAGGNAVRALLRTGTVLAEQRVLRVLNDIGVNTETVKLFLAEREVVRQPEHVGGRLEARPIIPGVELDNISNYTESDGGYEFDVQAGKPVVYDNGENKYKLNTLFNDTTLTDKLRISARRLQSAKRLALSDPSGAAASLTDYIQAHGFPRSRVLAGDYARSVNNAIAFIHAMGKTITYADAAAPAVVMNNRLAISFDQFHKKEVIWTVVGPLKYATEINIVYQLAILYGPEHVLFLLGRETLCLKIDIRDERTQRYYTGEINGYSSLAGIQPCDYGCPSELTADQQVRLRMAAQKVSPVRVGDAVIGSAVHVTDKHAILNDHTLVMAAQSDMVPELRGKPILESAVVSGDVCMVRCDGVHAQWLFRESDVGERVVLCYSVGDTVEYSEVLQVLSNAGDLVLTGSNILRKGASGAAVIALRDSALLGIFSTMRLNRVLCAPFTSSSFAIVTDCQSVASVSQYAGTPGVDVGSHTYSRMVKRGLLGFLEGISRSTTPLYAVNGSSRVCAGLAANVAGDWYTTVDPDVAQLMMADSRLLTFGEMVNGTYVAKHPPPVLQAVPNVRTVEPGERVFVFTKTDEDDVVMSSVRVVTHCMAGDRAFVVEDFGDSEEQMMSGVIVAERDAAVLGMYSRRDCDSFGQYSVYCVTFNRQTQHDTSAVAVDCREVQAELVSWVLPVEETLLEYAEYGKLVWRVMVGRSAYLGGALLSRVRSSDDMWTDRYRQVLERLSWPSDVQDTRTLGHVGSRHDARVVAYAILAMVYLRSADYVIRRLADVVDDVLLGVTPISGFHPIPRVSSAAGSATSARTATDPDRLLELEQRVQRLTSMVADQAKRASYAGSDDRLAGE